MKKLIKNNWKKFIFIISITIFLLLVAFLLKEQLEVFDTKIYSIISKLKSEPLTIFFKFISFLCSTYFILIAIILLLIFSKNKKLFLYITLNILICAALNQGLKLLFSRARPTDINLIIEKGYSFPSGHSMISLSFYGFLIYTIIHQNINKKQKILYCILLAILILLIGISRIYLGVHYASDVLAGFSLSMAYLIIFITLTRNRMID